MSTLAVRDVDPTPETFAVIHAPRLSREDGPILVTRAGELVITSDAEFAVASSVMNQLSDIEKAITEDFKDSIAAAHKAHKTLTEQRKRHLDPIQGAITMIKGNLGQYHTKREAEERERVRLAEEAERKRRDVEAMAEAERLEREGRSAEAEIALVRAAEAPAPVIVAAPPTPKLAGGPSFVKVWRSRVVNEEAFYAAAAKDVAVRACAPIDEGKLNKIAAQFDGKLAVPGVEFYQEDSVRRAGR